MKTDFTKYLKPILPMIGMLIAAASAEAEYPDGYYDSLDGKCGKELMTAVKNVAYNHTEINYGGTTWDAFMDTDVKNVDGIDYWWDMYSSNLVAVSSGHPGMNIEHSVANSWWGKTKNAAYKDLCHLNPSDQDANSRKSNYPLAELDEVTWNNGVTFIGYPKSGMGGGANYCFEPADEYKGDFARAFMYMFTIYNDITWKESTDWMYNVGSDLMFRTWASDMLIRWSTNDPVSQKERDRNDGIYKNQKNRNPFIDLPDLADHIWGSKKTEPYDLNGTGGGGGTGGGDDQDSTTYRWLDEADSSMGDWTIEDVSLPEAGTYVWSWKSYNGMSYLNGSAYISGTPYESLSYAWSPTVSLKDASSAKFSFEHAAKFQTTLRDICKVVVKDVATGAVSEVAIPTWPGAGSWTFVDSGTIDLASFLGKEVNIGFKYASTTSGADTWEIKNAALVVEKATSGMERLNIEEEDDSFLVEVWGNNILAPQGAHIFDMNGREVSGENLSKGVYIVMKPSFEKSVKVMIGK